MSIHLILVANFHTKQKPLDTDFPLVNVPQRFPFRIQGKMVELLFNKYFCKAYY